MSKKKLITHKENQILVECSCGDWHKLEVCRWNDDDELPYLINFIDYPTSFLQTIKGWWKHRHRNISEISLNQEQMEEFIKELQNLIK